MRLGLMSTMAALLACNGLALGQAPEVIVQEQVREAPRPLFHGLLRPVAAVTTVQAPSPMPPGAPATGPAPTLVPVAAPTVQPACAGESCAAPSVLTADACAHPEQVYKCWISGEYILWRVGAASLPSLGMIIPLNGAASFPVAYKTITTTTDAGGNITQAQFNSFQLVPGVLTVDASLPGGNTMNFRDQPGYRIRTGAWLCDDQTLGVDFNFFWLWRRTIPINAVTNTNLTAPTDVNQQQINVTITATTGSTTTSIEQTAVEPPINVTVNLRSELHATASNRIWGFDTNFLSRTCWFGPFTLDIGAGFRFLQIDQELVRQQAVSINPSTGQTDPNGGVNFNTPTTPPPIPNAIVGYDPIANGPLSFLTGDATAGFINGNGQIVYASTVFLFNDIVQAHSNFYGFQLGAMYNWDWANGFFINGFGKVAIGDLHQEFNLRSTAIGFLVNPLDNNTFQSSDRICFIPEFNFNLGYNVTSHLKLYAGYNVLFISSLARVSSPLLVATTTNSLTIGEESANATATRFGFKFNSASTTLQGITMGAEYRW